MSASKHVAVWPKVRLSVKGERKVIERGESVPAGVTDAELANLVSFGAITGVIEAKAPVEATTAATPVDYDQAKANINAVLAHVGEDQALAAEALEFEKGRGEDTRPTLVEKLEALAKPPAGD